MQPDIICLGEPLIELNQTAGGDGAFAAGFGGDASNCAVAGARQGAHVGVLTALGSDAFGDRFLALWREEGIDTTRVIRNPAAHTGLYFISHGPAGHEFTYMRAGSATSRIGPSDMPEDFIAAAKVLHTSGITQAISASACDAAFHAMRVARRHGVRISYDPNLRLKLWPLDRARAIIHAAVALADVLLLSHDDAVALCGREQPEQILDFYAAMGPRVTVLKQGAAGAWLAEDGATLHLPGHAVATVDATGAGDTFAGAFLAELVAGRAGRDAARYANAAAALSTTGWGAVAPIPRRDAVESFLAGGGAG